jgi:hypothetical protein
MTQDEQETDLIDARTYLSVTTMTAERCRHESVKHTSLWFFSGTSARQVASATRLAEDSPVGHRWRVSYIRNGQPVTSRTERSLLDVIGYVMRYDQQR